MLKSSTVQRLNLHDLKQLALFVGLSRLYISLEAGGLFCSSRPCSSSSTWSSPEEEFLLNVSLKLDQKTGGGSRV
jgi:hypothetical protein